MLPIPNVVGGARFQDSHPTPRWLTIGVGLDTPASILGFCQRAGLKSVWVVNSIGERRLEAPKQ